VRFRIEGPAADAGAAWGLVADTDWLNRAGGNGEMVDLRMELVDGCPMMAGATVGPGGTRIPFVETGVDWVQGRFFRQERRWDSRLIARSCYRAELVDDPTSGGVRPVIELELDPAGALGVPVVASQHAMVRRRWQALLNALPTPDGAPRPGARTLPPQNLRSIPPPTGAGPAESAPQTLERPLPPAATAAIARWRDREGVRGDVVDGVIELFRRARPFELERLRPFELADLWAMDRQDVLVTFLEGVDVGALELFWSVRCVRCHGEVAAPRTLAELAEQSRCPSCRIDAPTDLGRNVEVLFAPHPAITLRVASTFCTLFPAGAPEQVVMATLAPGADATMQTALPPGRWRVGPGGDVPDLVIEAGADGRDQLRWVSSEHPAGAAPRPPVQVRAGAVDLTLVNDGPSTLRVSMTASDPHDDRVPAALLTTMPTFRRRMAHDVLAPGLRLAVREVTLVFTDLTDSTAMFETLGDAGAFAFVRDHFDLLRNVVEAAGGVVVKTIGDAVMAAFHDPRRGLEAALEMRDRFEAWAPAARLDPRPRLKVGVHAGPVLAVRTPASGLDYFGRTVNVAARTQGAAGPGEVVLTADAADRADAPALLADRGLAPVAFDATLKGIAAPTRLFRC